MGNREKKYLGYKGERERKEKRDLCACEGRKIEFHVGEKEGAGE